MHERRTSFPAGALVAAGVVAVLALTLRPSQADSEMFIGFWCFFCGSGGVADGLLNILLFMPLGAGLGLLGGTWTALAGSLGLSGFIELVQTGLPGRFPSAEDLLLTTLGGLAGWAVARHWPRLLRSAAVPSGKSRVLALLLPASVYLATVLLSAPSFPTSYPWYGQWTHELGAMEPYPGRVLAASVAGHPLPDGPLPDQAWVQAAVARSEALRVTFLTGPPPPSLTHLFAIYDEKPQEIVLLGVQGSDLLFQRRTLSVQLRFDEPFLVWRGALDGPEGAETTVEIEKRGTDLCVSVDEALRCDLAPGLEGGWRLLHRFGSAPTLLAKLLGWIWMALLALPAGIFLGGPGREGLARGRQGRAPGRTPEGVDPGPDRGGFWRVAIAAVALSLSAALLSRLIPWLSFHPVQLFAPAAGALLGHGMASLLLREGGPAGP